MSRKTADAGDNKKYNAINGDAENVRDAYNSTCTANTQSDDDEDDGEDEDKNEENEEASCQIWLEVLPSKGGLLLAALLTEIMTEGLTPTQMNILGNFISSVGSLISYKASREDLDF